VVLGRLTDLLCFHRPGERLSGLGRRARLELRSGLRDRLSREGLLTRLLWDALDARLLTDRSLLGGLLWQLLGLLSLVVDRSLGRVLLTGLLRDRPRPVLLGDRLGQPPLGQFWDRLLGLLLGNGLHGDLLLWDPLLGLELGRLLCLLFWHLLGHGLLSLLLGDGLLVCHLLLWQLLLGDRLLSLLLGGGLLSLLRDLLL
jgi:hypothetical protein